MQDFSQRASAKTTTTNRLLPTSDHVSTSVHIYIPLEIIQKEERMVKINSSTGGGGINLHQKILLYYHWPSPKNNQNTKQIRGSNFKTVSTEKKQSHRKFMHLTCLNASSLRITNSFPSPTLLPPSQTLLPPPPTPHHWYSLDSFRKQINCVITSLSAYNWNRDICKYHAWSRTVWPPLLCHINFV